MHRPISWLSKTFAAGKWAAPEFFRNFWENQKGRWLNFWFSEKQNLWFFSAKTCYASPKTSLGSKAQCQLTCFPMVSVLSIEFRERRQSLHLRSSSHFPGFAKVMQNSCCRFNSFFYTIMRCHNSSIALTPNVSNFSQYFFHFSFFLSYNTVFFIKSRVFAFSGETPFFHTND